jgi:hypothetical protein
MGLRHEETPREMMMAQAPILSLLYGAILMATGMEQVTEPLTGNVRGRISISSEPR